MNYKIQISERAEIEIKKAEDWYESQSIGLGERFVTELKGRIESSHNPLIEHKLAFKILRRVFMHHFPYVIYYFRDEQKLIIEIIAVLHNKQSRDTLENRV